MKTTKKFIISEADKKIGENLRFIRKSNRMKLVDLAIYLGITYQQVRKYESGENRISAASIFKCAKIIKCPIECFFENVSW
jgi:transcriptional regulator with XRE-family HTH domain